MALVPVDDLGRVDVDRFAEEVRRTQTVIAAIQHANHEVGTIQPVAEAAMLAHEAGVLFHMDARQTAGRLPLHVDALGVDLLSMSGHTIGGGPGAGALYVRRGVRLSPLFWGDDRERRRRAGMQNVPAIAAMAAAVKAALDDLGDRAARDWSLTTRLRRGLEGIEGIRLHGHPTQRAPHLVCFSASDVDTEVLLMALDQRGLRLDGGSVATGSPHEPSAVLAAMGVPDTVGIRASVGPGTSDEDIVELVTAVTELVEKLVRMGRARP